MRDRDFKPAMTITRLYICVIILIAIGLTIARVDYFESIVPRMDHTTSINWVKSIFQADHFLPITKGQESWQVALEKDPESLIHTILKPIYTAPTLLFISVSIAWFSFGAVISGISAESQIAWSIIAHSGMLILLALLPLCAVGFGYITRGIAIGVGALTFVFAASSSFLHAFSPLGAHNVGVLTLIIATIVISRYLDHIRRGQKASAPLAWAVLAQTVACYAMYANIFILPVATVLVILMTRVISMRQRFKEVACFSLLTVVSFTPALTLLTIGALYPHSSGDPGSFSNMTKWAFRSNQTDLFSYISANFINWVSMQSAAYTQPGLVLGFSGLYLFGRRFKIFLPFALACTHLLVWVIMPLYANTRTPAYLIPFLTLGTGMIAMIVFEQFSRFIGSHRSLGYQFLSILLLAGLGYHVWEDLPRTMDVKRNQIWGGYYAHQGKWKAIMSSLNVRIAKGSILIPWDTYISHTYSSLSNRPHPNVRVFKPLDTLYDRQQRGLLQAYILRRQLVIPPASQMYLLAPNTYRQEDLSSITTKTLCHSRLSPCQIARLTKLDEWPSGTYHGGSLILYSLKL